MVTIILPGYSAHNKNWLEETAQTIGVQGNIRAVYWDHWTDPAKKFNPKEKGRLIVRLNNLGHEVRADADILVGADALRSF